MSQTTKKALAASFQRLLNQKPLNKITIRDLTADCGINRMTFYYHFKDIYNLIEWTFTESITKALDGKQTEDTWQQGFLNIFHAVLENKTFILNIYRSISWERVEEFLYKLSYGPIITVIEEKSAGMVVPEKDKAFMADFYKYAFVGILLNWMKNRMKEDPEQIIQQLTPLVQGEITRALQAYRLDQ